MTYYGILDRTPRGRDEGEPADPDAGCAATTSSRRREDDDALAITPRAESRLVPAASVAGVLAAAAAGWLVLVGRMAGMDSRPRAAIRARWAGSPSPGW